jgi:uncharacterized damage-inducible protein DinB
MHRLSEIFDGWNGYQSSLVAAVAPLTREQLIWRPAPHLRSTGELARHISLGRITWFARMHAPGSREITQQIEYWDTDRDGNRDVVEDQVAISEDASRLVEWLERTWHMIEETLGTWEATDLKQTYDHIWKGKKYHVSRQWTVWRILSHDIHHGGELSVMLGLQGIDAFELSELFGHIILPPLAE